jgi:hypothetical protein
MKWKIGDTVKVINWGWLYSSGSDRARLLGATNWKENDSYYYNKGEKDTICKVIGVGVQPDQGGSTSGIILIKAPNGIEYTIGYQGIELIKSSNNIMDNLKSAFVNLFTTEPAKSFKKAGIINGDNLLTPEGTEVFINWLFTKPEFQKAFNEEVVQPLLVEAKKNEK